MLSCTGHVLNFYGSVQKLVRHPIIFYERKWLGAIAAKRRENSSAGPPRSGGAALVEYGCKTLYSYSKPRIDRKQIIGIDGLAPI